MFAGGPLELPAGLPREQKRRSVVKGKLALALIALAVGLIASPLGATPPPDVVSGWAISDNMRALGYSPREIPLANAEPGAGSFNSDLAFWGDTAVQGTYAGFRLVDVSKPTRPQEIVNWEACNSRFNTQGNQGDVIIWGELLIRSWNSPTPAPIDPATGMPFPVDNPARYTTPGSFCGDWPMFREPADPATGLPERGQEGVHVIDISDPQNPDVVAFVDIPCGSHTETLVPDLGNNRLLVYSNASANTTFGSPAPGVEPLNCRGIDIVEVPLADPAAASYLRFEPSGDPAEPVEMHHACHDTGVILGSAMKVACSGGTGMTILSLDPADGGSLEDPMFMHHIEMPEGVTVGHTAAFTWDGKYAIFGHEPGGGSSSRCQVTGAPIPGTDPPLVQTDLMKTLFFIDVEAGEIAGTFLHPRPQTSTENCTWHNLNAVPLRKKGGEQRYVLVSGNYQSGISVVDFSDPANAKEIAYADPPPLVNPDPSTTGIELGGDWSSYWYNGRIYESDITRGLIIWRLNDPAVTAFLRTPHSNPQTQLFTID
jgi:hypothetical protein